MNLGERVAHAINESGVDVREIAKVCDVSGQAVYSWIRGEVKNLRNDNLFALSDITGFNARWIGTGEGPQVDAYKLNPRIAHVVKIMENMPEVVQDEAVKEVDSLADFARRLTPSNGTHG